MPSRSPARPRFVLTPVALVACALLHQPLARAQVLQDEPVLRLKPSQALRRGRETSMWRALESVKAGEAAGAVSAGNTGALMAIARYLLKTLDGIDPWHAIAVFKDGRRGAAGQPGSSSQCGMRQLGGFARSSQTLGKAQVQGILSTADHASQ